MGGASLAGVVLGALLGAAVGIGGYTFVYARGYSYLIDDPQACMNCHVMREQFDGWVKSSHRSVATCNSCHTPHRFFAKWFVKAENGFRHSFAFTTGRFPEPIRIVPADLKVTESTCRSCHAAIVDAIDSQHAPGRELSCVRCHRNVGHLHAGE
ncbi:MAG: cytochrome c nitrite reductase small subunit [Deltaproteobacteria bacterium]|nr:MAG: cytochrome c nitrite reductase small subunit [Deltaproteobacteria bacterium]TMB43314.1 MAG: cytochrome c nitrite reductase small subunit [Deltaproteobacteria bacterium]